jgi:large repetitive protein
MTKFYALQKPFYLFLSLFLSFTCVQAQVTLSLAVTEKNSRNTFLAGDVPVLQLNYAVSSVTGNASGVKVVLNLPDEILNMQNLLGTVHAPIANFVFTNTVGAKKVTITFINPVPSGSAGVLEIGLRTKNGVIPNGTSLNFASELTATGGFTSGIQNLPITVNAAARICAQKTFIGGGAVGYPTNYQIKVNYQSAASPYVANIGALTNTNVILKDQLPAGATFISATVRRLGLGPTITTTYTNPSVVDGSNLVTLPLGDMPIVAYGTAWYGEYYIIDMQVSYPSPTFSSGQSVSNTAQVLYTPLGGTQQTLSNGNSIGSACIATLAATHTLAAPVVNATFSKSKSYGYSSDIYPTQRLAYDVELENTGNVDLDNVTVIETIPTQLRLAGMMFIDNDRVIDHYEYQTNSNLTWATLTGIGTSMSSGPNATEYYTAIKIVFKTPFKPNAALGTGAGSSNYAQLYFTPATPDVLMDTPISNCIAWNSTTSGIPASRTACNNSYTLKPRSNMAFTSLKAEHSPGCAGPYVIGTVTTSTVRVTIGGGGANLVDPIVMQWLPAGADYIANSVIYNPLTSGIVVTPTVAVLPNYANSGRTLLRWTFPTGTTIPYGTQFDVSSQMRLTNRMAAGVVLPNDFYFSGSNNTPCTGSDATANDASDLNGNGNLVEKLCTQSTSYWSCGLVMSAAASMESIKWVKGSLDADYSRYPDFGWTVPGGNADYKLIVKNTGNVTMKDIKIIDILPFVGDRGVIDPSARLTQWRPNLADPITAPAGVTVYYSTISNPCRDEVKQPADASPFPSGCVSASWSATPPTDITTVQSVKIDFGAITIAGGDSLIFNWPMRAPVNAPTNNEIAWNSFAFVGTRTDNNQPLLAAEPIKVGIKVQAGTPAFYGSFVWFDTNHNGIQDAGEGGVDGIRVKLYKAAGASPAPLTDLLVNFTITGNGGQYLFSNLTDGDYYAIICLPTGYTGSPANAAGSNADTDSDGTTTTYNGQPAMITAITHISAGETDLSWDQGIHCNMNPSVTGITSTTLGNNVTLTATGGTTYSWTGPNGFTANTAAITRNAIAQTDVGLYSVRISDATCNTTLTTQIVICPASICLPVTATRNQ